MGLQTSPRTLENLAEEFKCSHEIMCYLKGMLFLRTTVLSMVELYIPFMKQHLCSVDTLHLMVELFVKCDYQKKGCSYNSAENGGAIKLPNTSN